MFVFWLVKPWTEFRLVERGEFVVCELHILDEVVGHQNVMRRPPARKGAPDHGLNAFRGVKRR